MKINQLLRDYRAACIAADIDPVDGPASVDQVVRAIAEARRRNGSDGTRWWLAVDWLDDGQNHSETEHLAFLHLWVQTLFAAYRDEGLEIIRGEYHDLPLRELLAARGETLEWVEEDGEIQAVIVELERELEGEPG